jgi:hypothetical protein
MKALFFMLVDLLTCLPIKRQSGRLVLSRLMRDFAALRLVELVDLQICISAIQQFSK